MCIYCPPNAIVIMRLQLPFFASIAAVQNRSRTWYSPTGIHNLIHNLQQPDTTLIGRDPLARRLLQAKQMTLHLPIHSAQSP